MISCLKVLCPFSLTYLLLFSSSLSGKRRRHRISGIEISPFTSIYSFSRLLWFVQKERKTMVDTTDMIALQRSRRCDCCGLEIVSRTKLLKNSWDKWSIHIIAWWTFNFLQDDVFDYEDDDLSASGVTRYLFLFFFPFVLLTLSHPYEFPTSKYMYAIDRTSR